MITLGYILGGIVLVVVLLTVTFGEEKTQAVADAMKEWGNVMTMLITVPILLAFLYPPIGIPLVLLGVLVFLGWVGNRLTGDD